MAQAKVKFNPDSKKIVHIPFLFQGVQYAAGDVFPPEDTEVSVRILRGLYDSRRLVNAIEGSEEAKVAEAPKAPKAKKAKKPKAPKAKKPEAPKAVAVQDTAKPKPWETK